jgi:hypothetical protein
LEVVNKQWEAHKQNDNEKEMHSAAIAQYCLNSSIIVLSHLYVFITTVFLEIV